MRAEISDRHRDQGAEDERTEEKKMNKMRLRRWVLSFYVVQFFIERVLPRIRFSTWYPELPEGSFNLFCYHVRAGDIVFSSDSSKLSHFMIPGDWDHVGVVCDVGEGSLMIVEAVQPRVRYSDFFQFCAHSDHIAIARPKLEPADLKRFQEKAMSFVGRKYDALFEEGSDHVEALYCSEIVTAGWPYCDESGSLANVLGADSMDHEMLGAPYTTPDEIWNAGGLEKVFSSTIAKV